MAQGITPQDGPVAVTGASGYIGSRIVEDLVQQGYHARACVRDASNADKVDHLLAMNGQDDAGKVTLHEADLGEPGSYDDAFGECTAVIHAGAALGFNKETPREVYDGCFTEVDHVLASARKSRNLRRFVFTSSFAAVGHPRPEGYVFTEKDWCGDNEEAYKGAWAEENIDKNRDIAYAKAKARTEHMLYEAAEADGSFDAISILPLHVIGPLMVANHDQPWSWQSCIRFLMMGKDFRRSKGGRMLWNCVDVRDTARAHRLATESNTAKNGSRYILSASDRSGELCTWELQEKLQQFFPDLVIGGEEMENGKPVKPTYDSPRAYCRLAQEELGLTTCSIDASIRETGESYLRLGLV